MYEEKELQELVALAQKAGADLVVKHDAGLARSEGRRLIESVQVKSGIPGVGPFPMAGFSACERLRAAKAAGLLTPVTVAVAGAGEPSAGGRTEWQYTLVICTTFRLLNGSVSEQAIEALLDEHMGEYPVALLKKGEGQFAFGLEMFDQGLEVGESFPARIHKLVDSVAPHVAEVFCLTLRQDTMSNDRDTTFFGGPSPAAIEDFRQRTHLQEALNALQGTGLKVDLARKLLEGVRDGMSHDDLVDPERIKAFITVEGGVVREISSTHAINVFTIDHDTQMADPEDVTQMPNGDEVVITEMPVKVELDQSDQLYAMLRGQLEARRVQNELRAERQR